MGYSCSAAASLVKRAMFKELEADGLTESGNGWNRGDDVFFWEQGKEQADGAITGTVYKLIPDGPYAGRYKRAGGVRIESRGIITRWAGIPRGYWTRAEAIGAAEFIQAYGADQARHERLLQR